MSADAVGGLLATRWCCFRWMFRPNALEEHPRGAYSGTWAEGGNQIHRCHISTCGLLYERNTAGCPVMRPKFSMFFWSCAHTLQWSVEHGGMCPISVPRYSREHSFNKTDVDTLSPCIERFSEVCLPPVRPSRVHRDGPTLAQGSHAYRERSSVTRARAIHAAACISRKRDCEPLLARLAGRHWRVAGRHGFERGHRQVSREKWCVAIVSPCSGRWTSVLISKTRIPCFPGTISTVNPSVQPSPPM